MKNDWISNKEIIKEIIKESLRAMAKLSKHVKFEYHLLCISLVVCVSISPARIQVLDSGGILLGEGRSVDVPN